MGNLYADKLAKALFLLFQKGGSLPLSFNIIAFARKDISTEEFRLLTKDFILKRGEIDAGELDKFLSHIEYIRGDFSNQADFLNLKNHISLEEDGLLVFHLATASNLYEKIFENIKNTNLHKLRSKTRVMIEKPFGRNESDAKLLQDVVTKIFEEEQIFHIDHYLGKETARLIPEFIFDPKELQKIRIIFHESNIVGSRGGSYDAVGAFRDVGQNHMLMLLALTIMDRSNESIRNSRLKALSELYLDTDQKITRAQYEDYHLDSNIDPNSKTETFFRVFLRSKDKDFSGVVFELEGGKGLIDMGSKITTTTVAVQIYFKEGKSPQNKEFKIQPVEGTMYESYVKVYNDVLIGDHTNFPSIEEIILEWKLTDELLSKWNGIPLVIYKKGSEAQNIK